MTRDLNKIRIDERRIAEIDRFVTLNMIEALNGMNETRASVKDSDFLKIEDVLVKKLVETWNVRVDKGLKKFVVMMDGVNKEVTDDLITHLILPYLDEQIAFPFYSSPQLRIAIASTVRRSWQAGKAKTANELGKPIV